VSQGGEGLSKDATGLRVNVKLVEELGADAYVYGELEGVSGEARDYVVRFDGRVPPRIGDTVGLEVRANEAHVFNPDTGERLG
jgi:multiple sugar transport system ATP-binding protein